jgi:protein-S-isoprenylcysteine O-methyltransferase Ste14
MSGWLQSRFPNIDWFSHDAGHLLEMMFGWKTNPHAGPFHILSFVFIGGGFLLISVAWKVLYDAQQRRSLATSGPYSYVRHPQYVGFILVMFGFLLQWPTILTLAMFPVWTVMYVKLARSEEGGARSEFGDAYAKYAAKVPGFIPTLGRLLGPPPTDEYAMVSYSRRQAIVAGSRRFLCWRAAVRLERCRCGAGHSAIQDDRRDDGLSRRCAGED